MVCLWPKYFISKDRNNVWNKCNHANVHQNLQKKNAADIQQEFQFFSHKNITFWTPSRSVSMQLLGKHSGKYWSKDAPVVEGHPKILF